MDHGTSSLDRSSLLALLEASRAIISVPELDQVLVQVTNQAMTVFDAESASVLLLDANRNELVFHTVTGPKGDQLVGERFDATLGIAGQAMRTGRAVQVTDVKRNRHFFDGVDAKTHMRTQCLIAAPLIHREEVLGVVEIINPQNRQSFSDTDVELAQIFANLAAAAVRSGKVYDRISRDNRGFRESLPAPSIIGQSKPMQHVLELSRKVAATQTTVLITGETGTGKELIARAIHNFSDRRGKPFIAVNCAALPENLLESELFGHEKGAFTGADQRKLGRFELADGGTLFLDELGEIAQSMQVKLLRVLEEREFVRVGGTQTIVCNVRIITATNRDLKQEMQQGRFREDLFYRLNVFPIELPPLRQRLGDLSQLIEYFVQQIAPNLNVAPSTITPEAMNGLLGYHWPGNIRELRNIIERCTLLASGGQITLDDLPPEMAVQSNAIDSNAEQSDTETESRLANQERGMIVSALNETSWNQSAAARALGISRDHLRYRIRKYQLKKP